MDNDEDLITPNQYRTQHRSNSAMSQTVTSSSANRQALGASNPGSSQAQPGQVSQDVRLSQLQQGMVYLLDSLQEITGSQLEHRAIKRPAEQKPFEKKPNTKEECFLCKKLYANKTTLFRHYRGIHKEMNPEKYHGCSLNDTIVSLEDTECAICGYVAANQKALAQHNRVTHSNEADNANANTNKENINNNAVSNVKDKMFKCEDCACYFEERSKFDEHMKVQHGFEVVCKICNKNFLFKDIDKHVKDSHPDVYSKKDKDGKKEKDKLIVEKVMRNRKGKRVHVFFCTKCNHKFYDNTEAQKHATAHKKRLKINVAIPKKSKSNEVTDLTSDDNVIFTCEACDVSTGSYDAAVEHSQNHITNTNQLVTQTCSTCDLKFEPLCHKRHLDIHYKNKEIHKESFRYYKYKFQLVLKDDWVNSFDTNDVVMKEMMTRSIYSKTRSVKMMVVHDGQNALYKCCQCDHFVDPAAVVNHALNYDTCVKVKSSYACEICERNFNNRLTRDRHVKDHNDGDSFKIVLFNNVIDKEFNKILNEPRVNEVANNAGNSDSIDDAKILYKCRCGLCFVRKDSADVHKKVCPGKDRKISCPKCNNLFNHEELLAHCFGHHLNETRIIIEDFTADVIEIESDEETENVNNNEKEQENVNNTVIEIDSSDENDEGRDVDDINMEIVKSEEAHSNKDEKEKQEDSNKDEIEKQGGHPATEVHFRANIEQNGTQAAAAESGINLEEKEGDSLLTIFGEVNNDDSQDTLTRENTDSDADDSAPPINPEIKCIPTNLLLNPLHFENSFLNKVIKEEKPWWLNPMDYSKICRRPSLRQIDMASSSSQVIVESLITDDEEEMESAPIPESDSNIDKDLTEAQTNKDINVNNIDQAIPNTNMENYEDDDDDDLFLPSGRENTNLLLNSDLNNHENQISNDIQNKLTEQIANQDLINKEIANGIEQLEKLLKDMPKNVGSDNISVNLDNIDRQVADKEKDLVPERNIQSNYDDDTIDYEENNPTNSMTNNGVTNNDKETLGREEINPNATVTRNVTQNNVTMRTDLASNVIPNNPTKPLNLSTTSKKEYTTIQIKTELLAQSYKDNEIDCQNDSLVEVKTEPNDRLVYNQNNKDSHIDITDNVNDNTCCIC